MVMTLHRRFLRTVRERKARYIGILVLIVLGSYVYTVAAGLAENLADLVTSFTEEHMQEDASFSAETDISKIKAIEKAAGAIIEEYFLYDVPLSETLTLRLLSETKRINTPEATEGQLLSKPGELLLDPSFAKTNGYTIGSRIEAAGKSFTVVGLMSLPHYIYPLKNVNDVLYSPKEFGVALIQREDFSDIPNTSIRYSVRFMDRTQSFKTQALELRKLLQAEGIPVSDWVDIMDNKRARMVWASITGMKTMSVPLPVLMFLISCLIIGIMFRRMIRQEGVTIGTLYAQGFRRQELTRHYLTIPLLLALFGGLIGTLLGLPSVEPTVKAMVSYYNVPVPGIALNPLHVVLGIGAPVLFLGLSTYLVIGSELKHTPVELMKGDVRKTKVNVLERSFRLERFKFNTKFKLREQFRSISRLAFLFLGVCGASVLMLFGFTIMNSFGQVFKSSSIYQFAYEYSFRDPQIGEAPEGAESFNAGKFYPLGKEELEFYITGIEPDSQLVILKDDRGKLLHYNQTNITKPLADRLGIKVGDTVSFINKEDGKSYTFHIDAIVDSYIEQFIYLPLPEFNVKMGYPGNSYRGLFSTKALDIPDEALSGIKNMAELPEAMNEFMGQTTSMVVFMALVSSLVALIILYLVTSMVIEENKTSISLFKIFGYRRREIRQLILNSSRVVIIVGFMVAIPIAVASMEAVYSYLGSMINLVLPAIVSPLYVAIAFAAIMLTYELSKALCTKSVESIPMSEALKAGME